MNVVNIFWRCSLAATAIFAMLGAAPAPLAADDQPSFTPPAAADREKIEQQMRSIKEKIGQFERDGKHEDADRLRKEARELYSRIQKQSSATTAPGGPEREQLRKQWLAIREKMEQAEKDGKPEDAQRLRQYAEALRAKLYPPVSSTSAGAPSGGDLRARMQHLRAAAENLKAAGFESETQHVMQIIQKMEAEARAVSERSLAESQIGRKPRPGEIRSFGDPSMEAIRGQIDELRREMRTLREEVNRAKSSQRD